MKQDLPAPHAGGGALSASSPWLTATTLCAMLARHAAGRGDVGCVYTMGEHGRTLTYGDLWAAAWRWRAHLAQAGLGPGMAVHIALPNGTDFVEVFFGALLLGAMAAPMPPADGMDQGQFERLLAGRAIAGVSAACVTSAAAAARLHWVDGVLIAPDGDKGGEAAPLPGTWQDNADPEEIAVLQFTSGTSGRPKAVALSHRALIHQTIAISEALALEPVVDHAMSWLPLFHDMGLIGFLLTPLWSGGKVGLMPTEEFLRYPWSWFEAIAASGATITAAPPSAWLLTSRLASRGRIERLSLQSLRVALVGAERIDASVAARITARLEPAGLRPQAFVPAYGMAEVGLAVTIDMRRAGFRSATADGEAAISCGAPVRGTTLRIMDADGRPLPEGQMGDIEVATPSLMSGYHGDARRSAAVLRDGWYRTGDRGFIMDDELHVIGRSDEQIIIGGRNYAPECFERLALGVPELAGGRAVAFGIRDASSGTERAVLLIERRGAGPEIVAIVRAAADRENLPLGPVKLVPPGTIILTRNGKTPRGRIRDAFLREMPAHEND